MSRLLITSGPTREFLDPVRFLTNSSGGRMGCALATAALESGYEVTIVSGPVTLEYPQAAWVIPVTTTQEMLDAALEHFPNSLGVIGVAAPCDYRPREVSPGKLKKTGQPRLLELVETPDILATLGQHKQPGQFILGFALETEDLLARAAQKLVSKNCDLIVLNGPEALHSAETAVEVMDRRPNGSPGGIIATCSGSKEKVANAILKLVAERWPPS